MGIQFHYPVGSYPTNELQTLSIQGDSLSITNGNTVALPVSLDNDSTNELQNLMYLQQAILNCQIVRIVFLFDS